MINAIIIFLLFVGGTLITMFGVEIINQYDRIESLFISILALIFGGLFELLGFILVIMSIVSLF